VLVDGRSTRPKLARGWAWPLTACAPLARMAAETSRESVVRADEPVVRADELTVELDPVGRPVTRATPGPGPLSTRAGWLSLVGTLPDDLGTAVPTLGWLLVLPSAEPEEPDSSDELPPPPRLLA
jgi:hypothetical protein